MNNEIYVLEVQSKKKNQDSTYYYFHSYINAVKRAKEYAIEAEGKKDGFGPEDFNKDCHTWKELIDHWFAEGKSYLVDIPEWMGITSEEFED